VPWVVEVQRRMQAVSMAFLPPVLIVRKSRVPRILQPTEDRVSLGGAKQSLADITKVIAAMGHIVAPT
jgi:hypothetical protein